MYVLKFVLAIGIRIKELAEKQAVSHIIIDLESDGKVSRCQQIVC